MGGRWCSKCDILIWGHSLAGGEWLDGNVFVVRMTARMRIISNCIPIFHPHSALSLVCGERIGRGSERVLWSGGDYSKYNDRQTDHPASQQSSCIPYSLPANIKSGLKTCQEWNKATVAKSRLLDLIKFQVEHEIRGYGLRVFTSRLGVNTGRLVAIRLQQKVKA